MREEKNYNLEQYEKSFNEFADFSAALREKYRIKVRLTKADLENFPKAKAGDLIGRNPEIPNEPKAAFELFKNFYASLQFELQKHLFFEKYRVWNKATVKIEIDEIQKWIEEAKKLNYAEMATSKDIHSPYWEYLRLENEYYKGYLMTWQEHQESSTAAFVYGRYFLFFDYLKEKLKRLQQESRKDFQNWLMGTPAWRELAWEYNTARKYQGKQDLVALFWNNYVYYQDKVEKYYEEFRVLPLEVLNNLIFEFRQSFPQKGRVENINYFDDLIEQLIEKYNSQSDLNEQLQPEETQVKGNPEFTTARQVLAIHYLLEYCQVKNVDNTAKARFVQFLTGKEAGATRMQNTTIYKKVSKPFSNSNKTLNSDLQFVRKYFEELGLAEISKAITNEISKSEL